MSILIFAQGRTGSSLLESLLGSTGYTTHGERCKNFRCLTFQPNKSQVRIGTKSRITWLAIQITTLPSTFYMMSIQEFLMPSIRIWRPRQYCLPMRSRFRRPELQLLPRHLKAFSTFSKTFQRLSTQRWGDSVDC